MLKDSLRTFSNYKLDNDVYFISWTNLLNFEQEYLSNSSFSNCKFFTGNLYDKDYSNIMCDFDYIDDFNCIDNLDKLDNIDNLNNQNQIESRYNDIFPYNPLNIDETIGILYKDDNYKWKLITMNNFSTNTVHRCQQGSLTQYELVMGKKNPYDLILLIDLFSNGKYCTNYQDERKYLDDYNIINNKYRFYYNKFKQIKNDDKYKIPYGSLSGDSILNLLFENKLHYYDYNNIKINKNGKYFIGIKFINYSIRYLTNTNININTNTNQDYYLIIEYLNNQYLYKQIGYCGCCGHGDVGTYILLKKFKC